MSPARQLGSIWGALAVALVALSPWAPRIAAGLPACPWKLLAGVPCPGCGTTRSALALAEFDPLAALAVSPLATLGWVFLIVGGLVAGALVLLRREPPMPPATLTDPQRWAVIATVVANWLYLIWSGA
ncbi:MAG: DUF2752 domain-containing protein [Acidobacteriota bacterium]